MALLNQFHDGFGPGKNLLGGVDLGEMPIIAVVGANEHDGHLGGLSKIELPVLQVPEDLFGAVTVIAQIDRPARREMSLPNSLQRLILAAQLTERLGDGVTNQNQVVVTGPDRSHLFRMPLTRRRRGEIGVTRSRGCLRKGCGRGLTFLRGRRNPAGGSQDEYKKQAKN